MSLHDVLLAKAMGGGGDWHASEGEPGHVLNRTHYIKPVHNVIVEEATLTFNEEGSVYAIAATPTLDPDAVYQVNYNGVKYECTVMDLSAMSGGAISWAMGNAQALGGADTGEPFFFAVSIVEQMSMILPLDGIGEPIVFGIVQVGIAEKLPKMFLPVDEISPVVVAVFDQLTHKCTLTANEIKAFVGLGKNVFFSHSNNFSSLSYVHDDYVEFTRVYSGDGSSLYCTIVRVDAEGTITSNLKTLA